MQYVNTKIAGLGIYHPDNQVDNNFFVEHFGEMGTNAEKLMLKLGRKKRYLVDNHQENSISMAVNASTEAMKNARISPDMLDMIVFVTETPEYLVPTNALVLNHELGAANANIVYDMNANCIGMIDALDNTCRYLKNNRRIKYALVVGSLLISSIIRKDCIITYPNIADGSAAVVIESKAEDAPAGFIDSDYFTNPSRYELIMSPGCGFSSIFDSNIQEERKKLCWVPHEVDFFSEEWKKLILKLLERNSLTPESIDQYFFSQFSKPDAESTLVKLGLDPDKHTFVGEQYGYTGCTSPFFALNEAIKLNKVTEGSTVVFCSVGAGFSMSAVLFRL